MCKALNQGLYLGVWAIPVWPEGFAAESEALNTNTKVLALVPRDLQLVIGP